MPAPGGPVVVTISANYGCAGLAVAQEVAARMGLEVLDRMIAATVADSVGTSLEAALAVDEHGPSRIGGLLQGFAMLANPTEAQAAVAAEAKVREETERLLRERAQDSGGVVLGRAGMVVLRGRPNVFHVRLDGPPAARELQAARLKGITPAQAHQERVHTDRARDAYVRYFYRVHREDWRLYHLLLDATAVEPAAMAEAIVVAATSYLSRAQPAGGQR